MQGMSPRWACDKSFHNSKASSLEVVSFIFFVILNKVHSRDGLFDVGSARHVDERAKRLVHWNLFLLDSL